MASSNLIAAIITTAEVMGQEIGENAAKMMVQDLSEYEESEVFVALKRCRQEVKGKLTIADVIQRIDFGHIGAEEAWALCPKSEMDTVVWTKEISDAYFVALPILENGDKIAARMAFIEAYKRNVSDSKKNKIKANWYSSLGWDTQSRITVIEKAQQLGRLPKPENLLVITKNESSDNIEKSSSLKFQIPKNYSDVPF